MLKNFKWLVLLFVIQLSIFASNPTCYDSDDEECGILHQSTSSSDNAPLTTEVDPLAPAMVSAANVQLKIQKKLIDTGHTHNFVTFTFETDNIKLSKQFRIDTKVEDKRLEDIGNIWVNAINAAQETALPLEITSGVFYDIFDGKFKMEKTAEETVIFYFNQNGIASRNQFPAKGFSAEAVRSIAESWIDMQALKIQFFTQVLK